MAYLRVQLFVCIRGLNNMCARVCVCAHLHVYAHVTVHVYVRVRVYGLAWHCMFRYVRIDICRHLQVST